MRRNADETGFSAFLDGFERLHQGWLPTSSLMLLGPLLEVLVFPGQAVLLEGVPDGQEDALPVQRLLQEVEGAQA
jgi:hypothetical protein